MVLGWCGSFAWRVVKHNTDICYVIDFDIVYGHMLLNSPSLEEDLRAIPDLLVLATSSVIPNFKAVRMAANTEHYMHVQMYIYQL